MVFSILRVTSRKVMLAYIFSVSNEQSSMFSFLSLPLISCTRSAELRMLHAFCNYIVILREYVNEFRYSIPGIPLPHDDWEDLYINFVKFACTTHLRASGLPFSLNDRQ